MLICFFFALLLGCIGGWSMGAPAWLVFVAALATWAAFCSLVYPKIRAYKAAMGIDEALGSVEASGWRWIKLRLAGFKVLIVGFLTSMVPFLGAVAEWLNGQKLDFFFSPNDPVTQQRVMFAIGAVVFAMPFLMQWLHSNTAATAAETPPKA